MFQNINKLKNGTVAERKDVKKFKTYNVSVSIQFGESKSSNHLSKYLLKS